MTGELAHRLRTAPGDLRAEFMGYAESAPGEELAASRDQFAGVADYLRKADPVAQTEALRLARLAEWWLAQRWPKQTGQRIAYNDRPFLDASKNENFEAWSRVYSGAGAVDREWLESEDRRPRDLTQAAVRREVEYRTRREDLPDLTGASSAAASFAEVLLVDPPWRYDMSLTDSRRVENHYPTMAADELAALELPLAEHAVVFCWATSPKTDTALNLLAAWGLTYKTQAVWVKDHIGMGYYFRQQHELLLVATKGSPPLPAPSARPSSVVSSPRGAHSVKPLVVYDLIEAMYPDAVKQELFARTRREGWLAPWGLDAPQEASA